MSDFDSQYPLRDDQRAFVRTLCTLTYGLFQQDLKKIQPLWSIWGVLNFLTNGLGLRDAFDNGSDWKSVASCWKGIPYFSNWFETAYDAYEKTWWPGVWISPTDGPDHAPLKAAIVQFQLQEQGPMTKSLMQAQTLTPDDYFFMLHFLMLLNNSDTAAQSTAREVIELECSTRARPNDTFINQLVYLSLMRHADPDGPFDWKSAQLPGLLDLTTYGGDGWLAVLGNDPASTAIQDAFAHQMKILNSDVAYPMQDPYSDVTFDDRMSDTLAALDKARATWNQ